MWQSTLSAPYRTDSADRLKMSVPRDRAALRSNWISFDPSLTKVFSKASFLHVRVSISFVRSVRQFLVHKLNKVIESDLLIAIFFKIACHLQKCLKVTLQA
uniref:Uncharacterized protein n=1 Tax=Anguilla anguilla TaxID=7936 RepID=A0A0E9VPC3_ANGAN